MKITNTQVDIFSVQLSKLQNIYGEINEAFLNELTDSLSTEKETCWMSKYSNYWLVNSNLTVNTTTYMPIITVFNVLLQYARSKCTYLQITNN